MKLLERIKGAGLKTRLLHPVDEFWDRRLGVHTVGFLPEVGTLEQPDWRAGYVPARYPRIVAALRRINVGPDDAVVDLGCGLGRAVFAASWLGARHAVGVEIDPPLAEQARKNHASSRLKHRSIEFACAPAEQHSMADMTVLFMFNPFGKGTMQAVVRNLETDLERKPRHFRIAYENPLQSEVLDRSRYLKRIDAWAPKRFTSPHPIAFWESTL